MASNAFVGKLIASLVLSIVLYYFFWVFVLPFMLIEEDNIIHSFFLPLQYAFAIPAAFGVCFVGGLSVFTFYHIWDHVSFF
ncbi:uncharacterized protein LOC129911575 [Episyrphus balteatus]|uniref:uncharacterized protein LOC129911575 n=1 Tax=Episyrphus balteatus TaxID=286459 RepID=UPI0024851DB9|nr:uncharacterized protein LOC129911575 [Episyrphus balteatus]